MECPICKSSIVKGKCPKCDDIAKRLGADKKSSKKKNSGNIITDMLDGIGVTSIIDGIGDIISEIDIDL